MLLTEAVLLAGDVGTESEAKLAPVVVIVTAGQVVPPGWGTESLLAGMRWVVAGMESALNVALGTAVAAAYNAIG